MKETDIYSYFAFGYNYYNLQHHSNSRLIHGDGGLSTMISRVTNPIEELDLKVTQQVAADLFANGND
jgi:hypothetical protein